MLEIRRITTNTINKEVNIMAKITKDMIIADIITVDQGIIPILMEAGMHCIGCPSSQGETLEEAAFVHGMDVDELINKINTFLESK
jgi:hybrid cluster-associated redox disulfide protein